MNPSIRLACIYFILEIVTIFFTSLQVYRGRAGLTLGFLLPKSQILKGCGERLRSMYGFGEGGSASGL